MPEPKTYEYAIEQIGRLDAKLGVGVGAIKERAKLTRIIQEKEAALEAKSSTPRTRRGKRGAKK